MKTTPAIPRFAIMLTAGAALVMSLGGCVPLVVGGAAAGAGMVATDRRTSGAQLDDQTIELRAAARIRDIANDNMNITAISFNRQVLLVGTVGTEADRLRAEEVVRRVENVRNVFNEVTVGPGSTIADRSNDTYITTKVKASLVDQNDLFGNLFKVVTERSVVYLMGLATRAETDRATDIVRGVSGVQKVVRLVEIISDAEANAVRTGGAGSPAPSSSGSSVPLPPMAPLPPAGTTAVPATPPASGGAVTTPVR
ncbi:BON domain-containing protein [Variovorax sp. J22R133]|uniref:BON domain-containing protein n=1 Tax=Variovorax brevis TaxID=3053503 RepID=UPI002575B7E5|nr:BON domain-containing protein [Variovorax sp. J22R133]MDM0115705.1 BON domain-containing protein [Variovorax sp. J22R133]